jgi:hypothetical protein
MGNFVLQIGPCSSLILRISPWGNPFPLLLCSLIPGTLIFFPSVFFFASSTGSSSSKTSFSLPLSSLHWYKRQAAVRTGSSGPERCAARAERRTARQAGHERGPGGSASGRRKRGPRLAQGQASGCWGKRRQACGARTRGTGGGRSGLGEPEAGGAQVDRGRQRAGGRPQAEPGARVALACGGLRPSEQQRVPGCGALERGARGRG